MTIEPHNTETHQRRTNAVTIRFPSEMIERIRCAAREDYTTTSSIVLRATGAYLQRRNTERHDAVTL